MSPMWISTYYIELSICFALKDIFTRVPPFPRGLRGYPNPAMLMLIAVTQVLLCIPVGKDNFQSTLTLCRSLRFCLPLSKELRIFFKSYLSRVYPYPECILRCTWGVQIHFGWSQQAMAISHCRKRINPIGSVQFSMP